MPEVETRITTWLITTSALNTTTSTRWLWNWLNSRPLKSENLNSEHVSISHAKTIILHFKFGTVNTSSMKVKAFSAASSPERTRKDRHLELLFLMIGISIALAFAHVSIVTDLNSQNLSLANYSVGCQKIDDSEGLKLVHNVNRNHTDAYDKDIGRLQNLQRGSPLTMWIVHNFGTLYTSFATLVIVLGCTCSLTPSKRRSS